MFFLQPRRKIDRARFNDPNKFLDVERSEIFKILQRAPIKKCSSKEYKVPVSLKGTVKPSSNYKELSILG